MPHCEHLVCYYPVRFTDPSGHRCIPEDECDNNFTIPRPTNKCGDPLNCNAAYLTYKELVRILGRPPTLREIMRMTVMGEGWGALHSPHVTNAQSGLDNLQEGLARAYYQICGKSGENCQDPGDALYKFLSGYQPWLGRSCASPGDCSVNSDKAKSNASKLAGYLNYKDGTSENLTSYVDDIFDSGLSGKAYPWSQTGKQSDKVWQWFTYKSDPHLSTGSPLAQALALVTYIDPSDNNTYYLYFFTGAQTLTAP